MFAGTDPDRHWGCRVNDRVTWHGLGALILQNELLQIVVLPDKGAEIVQLLYKPMDIDVIWRGPNALRDPLRFVPTGATPTTPFFDHWSGGWFEVVPNGGPPCAYNGAPLGFFGETINVPWECRILEDHPDRVRVGLSVRTYRTPFLLEKVLTLESRMTALFIEERLTNTGAEAMELMWGHHPVVGPPFLDASCRIDAPPCSVEVFGAEDGPDHRMALHQTAPWPIVADRNGHPLDLRDVPSADARTMDNCYLRDLDEGWIAITNQDAGFGFGLSWDVDVFRSVWLWQALGGGLGYPWYGRTYNVGLEPWTSYPCVGLAEAVKTGSAVRLEAGQHLDTWLSAVAYTGSAAVVGIGRDASVRRGPAS
jgi:hypothetical protein